MMRVAPRWCAAAGCAMVMIGCASSQVEYQSNRVRYRSSGVSSETPADGAQKIAEAEFYGSMAAADQAYTQQLEGEAAALAAYTVAEQQREADRQIAPELIAAQLLENLSASAYDARDAGVWRDLEREEDGGRVRPAPIRIEMRMHCDPAVTVAACDDVRSRLAGQLTAAGKVALRSAQVERRAVRAQEQQLRDDVDARGAVRAGRLAGATHALDVVLRPPTDEPGRVAFGLHVLHVRLIDLERGVVIAESQREFSTSQGRPRS